jgi:hypothetical protein
MDHNDWDPRKEYWSTKFLDCGPLYFSSTQKSLQNRVVLSHILYTFWLTWVMCERDCVEKVDNGWPQ